MPSAPPLSTLQPEPTRDRYGRPMVLDPSGKRVAYTRCTTFVKSIEDTFNLSRWQQRMVALGLASRPDLLLSVSAHRDDKKRLDEIAEQAQEAAKAHAAATTGTALHALTEQMDRGQEVGVVPDEYLADLAAYATATQDLKHLSIEQFSVNDWLKVGGTPDRVVRYRGKRYIADLKTGSIEFGFLSIAAQLAVYARSRPYDVTTDERLEEHGAELDRGLVIHLPAGTGTCRLYWVDLMAGWEAVKVARDVRKQRAIPFRHLMTPVEDEAVPVAPATTTQSALELDGVPLADQVRATRTRDEALALWQANASVWTPELTEVTKAHLASLGGAQ